MSQTGVLKRVKDAKNRGEGPTDMPRDQKKMRIDLKAALQKFAIEDEEGMLSYNAQQRLASRYISDVFPGAWRISDKAPEQQPSGSSPSTSEVGQRNT